MTSFQGQEVCQETNILHSLPKACWKCGMAVMLVLGEGIVHGDTNTKLTGIQLRSVALLLSWCQGRALSRKKENMKLTGIQLRDDSRRIRQLDPVISPLRLERSRIC